MFGTLKPAGCSLPPEARREHRRLYCGLCQTLGADYGQPVRALVSFDAVFLAVLVEGLAEQAAPADRTRCPLVPVVFRPTASPESPAMRFAAATSILLADQWLADRAADAGPRAALARRLRPLGSATAREAHATLAALGVDLSGLEGVEDRQQGAEVQGVTSPALAAAPTAAALRLTFAGIADLPGICGDAEVRERLGALGEAAGRIIYHLDALEDLEKDVLSGAFNPCLDGRGRPDPARVAACRAELRGALCQARTQVAALPWRRNRELVEDILLHRQGAAARRAEQRAEALLADEAEQSRLAVWRAWPAWRRGAWAATTLILSVFLWLQASFVAFAQQPAEGNPPLPPPPPPPPRRPAEGRDSGTPPPEEAPPPPLPEGEEGRECGGLSDALEDLMGCLGGCGLCCTEGPQEVLRLCGACDSSCRGCGQGCQGCGRTCEGCQGCGQCCQGCQSGPGGQCCCQP